MLPFRGGASDEHNVCLVQDNALRRICTNRDITSDLPENVLRLNAIQDIFTSTARVKFPPSE
jgi:hypothetical protein